MRIWPAWLDNLAGALGERLLRIKGLVRVAEAPRPLLVESVGTMFSPPRQLDIDEPPSSFIVVIARDVERAEVEQVAPVGLFHISSWQQPHDARPGRAAHDEGRMGDVKR